MADAITETIFRFIASGARSDVNTFMLTNPQPRHRNARPSAPPGKSDRRKRIEARWAKRGLPGGGGKEAR